MFLKNFILLNSKLGDGQDDFSGLVSSFKLPHNVSQLYAGRDFNHWTFYEELNFKYSSFLSYEDRNPCLRIGDVMRSAFIFAFLPLPVVTVIVALPAFLAVSLPVFLLIATTFGLEDVKDLRSVQPFGPILTVACAVVFFFMVSVGFVNLTLVASM